MRTIKNSQRTPDPAGFPRAVDYAFSPYALAFDDFAEPRTIPTRWDLSGLMDPGGSSNGGSLWRPGKGSSTGRNER
jgi:hypothetical protein